MFRRSSYFMQGSSSIVPSNSSAMVNGAAAAVPSSLNFDQAYFFLLDVQKILAGGANNKDTLHALYRLNVFKWNKKRQNPANVAQYILMQLVQSISPYNLPRLNELFNSLWDVIESNLADIVAERENGARYFSTIIYNLGLLAKNQSDWLKFKVSPSMLSTLVEALSKRNPESQDIANTFTGLSHLAKADLSVLLSLITPHNLDDLMKIFLKKESTTQELINMAFSTVHLPVSAASQQSLFKLLQTRYQQDKLSCLKEPIVWRQIHQFCGAAITQMSKSLCDDKLVHEILAMRSFFEKTQKEGAENVPSSSEVHKKYSRELESQIASGLKDCGAKITIESEVYCYGYFIDISILKNGRHWVAVEVNGPQHYGADGDLKHQYQIRENIVRSASGYVQVWNYSVCERNITANIKKLVSMLKSELIKENKEDILVGVKAVIFNESGVLHHCFFSNGDGFKSEPELACDFTITFN